MTHNERQQISFSEVWKQKQTTFSLTSNFSRRHQLSLKLYSNFRSSLTFFRWFQNDFTSERACYSSKLTNKRTHQQHTQTQTVNIWTNSTALTFALEKQQQTVIEAQNASNCSTYKNIAPPYWRGASTEVPHSSQTCHIRQTHSKLNVRAQTYCYTCAFCAQIKPMLS